MYLVEGHPLCLHCYSLRQEMLQRQIDSSARMINYLHDMFDDIAGLPPSPRPRLEVGTPVTVRTGPMTLNNVTVKDSVVGAINQGQIHRLDVAMDNVRAGGDAGLAEVLKVLTQTVVDAPDLAAGPKNEAVEHLSYVAEQAQVPNEQRSRAVGKTVLIALERLLNASASVAALWSVAKPVIEKVFS